MIMRFAYTVRFVAESQRSIGRIAVVSIISVISRVPPPPSARYYNAYVHIHPVVNYIHLACYRMQDVRLRYVLLGRTALRAPAVRFMLRFPFSKCRPCGLERSYNMHPLSCPTFMLFKGGICNSYWLTGRGESFIHPRRQHMNIRTSNQS